MKNVISACSFLMITLTVAAGEKEDRTMVKETLLQFAAAADAQQAEVLDKILDPNFRIVMNRLFGSTAVAVMDKTTYLNKIRAKEFGGDKRKVEIEALVINGNTASARVTFSGTKMTFVSFIQLIKTVE